MKYRNSLIGVSQTIPLLWEETLLKRFCLRITDGSHFSPETFDEGYPYITVKDLKEGKIDIENALKISKEDFTELVRNNCSPKKGDVLLSKDGTIGKVAIVGDEKCVVLSSLAILTPSKQILSEYLSYWFQSKLNIDQMESFLAGAALRRITLQTINKLRIVVPTIKEQRLIVSYLNIKVKEVDDYITNKVKLIRLLEEKRQSMITEAVTKGLNPNVKMKNSGVEWIGEIPDHWKKTRLDFIARVKARLGWKGLKAEEYVDEGYIFLSTPNLKGRNIDFENVNYITEERYLESPEIMLEVGDVLLAKDGSTLGITNVVRALPNKATVNSSIAVLRPRKNINSVYLYYYLTSTYIQDTINQIKDGMGVPHLFQADIKKFPTILPPLDEQEKISQYLDEETKLIESTVTMIKIQIQKLIEYRQSLIYEAVTGKIDVRGFEVVK